VKLNEKIGQKFENNGIQDGGAAIIKSTKTWITSEPLGRFSPNLVGSFALVPSRERNAQKRYFSKSKMAADEKLKFTKKWITSKRFVRFASNLVCSIHSVPRTGLWSLNLEIHNPRWPPGAILKFTKTGITSEPLITWSDSRQIWQGASTGHRTGSEGVKNDLFQNPRWPPTTKWILLKIELHHNGTF